MHGASWKSSLWGLCPRSSPQQCVWSWQINFPAASSLRRTILRCVVCSVKSLRGSLVRLCPVAHSGNLLINTLLIVSFCFLPLLVLHFPYKLLVLKYLSQGLLLKKLKLRQYMTSSLKNCLGKAWNLLSLYFLSSNILIIIIVSLLIIYLALTMYQA